MDFVLVERLGDLFDVVVINGEYGGRQITLGNLVITVSAHPMRKTFRNYFAAEHNDLMRAIFQKTLDDGFAYTARSSHDCNNNHVVRDLLKIFERFVKFFFGNGDVLVFLEMLMGII